MTEETYDEFKLRYYREFGFRYMQYLLCEPETETLEKLIAKILIKELKKQKS